ncbi:hypothetical protein C8A01DRAFT_47880 [Parachaetomium inaequale]|uniref:NACHT-NTPase sigma domain-containing protein n=1 Tax=Parachaetomium inaequale TaxID=2588326 RepID=A0AAN6SQI2_9PEZI|nr:hypothetical protein C8A01DRAFT_47880 [Parachaetomium inaequale]
MDPDPSEIPLIPSFPDGVKVLRDCPDATVDICFVHSLTGDREINRLIDYTTNLLYDLTTDRSSSNVLSRSLIFVVYSLGGLVYKKAILLSRNNPEVHLYGIFDCVKGVIFIGTPYKESWIADWAKIPASAVGLVKSANKSLLGILETDDQLLESIQVEFWSMVRGLREGGRGFEVTCFFEELPLPVVGKVVSKESAILEGYASFSIYANYSDMVKFASAEENGFKRLLGELIRWRDEARESAACQPPSTESQIQGPVDSSFYNYGGDQVNAPGGIVNISRGSGNQLPGATFSGPVHFGSAGA